MNAVTDIIELVPLAPQRVELIEPAAMSTVDIDPQPAHPLSAIEARPQRQLSVVEYAVQSGASVAEVRAVLELQVQADNHQLALMKEKRQMDKEDREAAAKEAYLEAFRLFKAKNIVVPKTKLVKQKAKSGGPGPTFKQSELDVVANLLQPALATAGLTYSYAPVVERQGNKAVWVSITCTLKHKLGFSESVTLGGPPDDSGAKNAQQEVQSTISFWERHTVLAITSTAQAGTDNDGRGARGYEEDEQDEQQQVKDAPLLQAGRDAALQGTGPLNKWWQGLTEADRTRMTPEFGSMRGAARMADQAGKAKSAI